MKDILLVELSHKDAVINEREKYVYNQNKIIDFQLQLKEFCQEVFILSTCNRLSVFVYLSDINVFKSFLHKEMKLPESLKIIEGSMAVNHLFNIACGLDSQVIGEHQILGQIRSAFELSKKINVLGPVLDEVIRRSITTGKRVRTETNIGQFASSIATVAYNIIQNQFNGCTGLNILVFGTGKMANLISTLIERGNDNILYVASHNYERAKEAARKWKAFPVHIDEAHKLLNSVDVVIGGTESEIDFFQNGAFSGSECKKDTFGKMLNRETLFIDLGMPRNFNPELKRLSHVKLYDLDDIKEFTNSSILQRKNDVPAAKKIINEEFQKFRKWERLQIVTPLIKDYLKDLEQIKQNNINWLMPKLGNLDSQQINVIERFMYKLIGDVSRTPLRSIKEIAIKDEEVIIDNLHIFKQVFKYQNNDLV